MSRRFALLVNPASAGGKALKALPAVHAELDRLGAAHRTVTTRSSEHAAEEARAGGRPGRDGRGARRRRAARARSPARCKDTTRRWRSSPAGAATTSRACSGSRPTRPRRPQLAVDGQERLLDVADVDGTPFVGIASFGFDSDANRIANEAKLVKGNAVYLYAALRALAAWKPAALHA